MQAALLGLVCKPEFVREFAGLCRHVLDVLLLHSNSSEARQGLASGRALVSVCRRRRAPFHPELHLWPIRSRRHVELRHPNFPRSFQRANFRITWTSIHDELAHRGEMSCDLAEQQMLRIEPLLIAK